MDLRSPETDGESNERHTTGSRPGKLPGDCRGEKRSSPTKMTTASPTTTAEIVEFTTAAEFFDGQEEPDHDGPHFAKGIVWFDQATPIFCCCDCHEHVAPLRFEGAEQVEDYDEFRAEQYRRLFEEDPTCDVCAGDLPEKVER